MTAFILMVEDDPTLVHSIERNLAVDGFEVQTATTLEQAIKTVHQEIPALVLLDISLPDGCGWDVVRELRAECAQPVPVVVMSALRLDPTVAMDMGAVAILEKPFSMEGLMQLVVRFMDGPRNVPHRPRLRCISAN